MPLHIKDEAATEAARRLARARKVTLTEAVRAACEEALQRDDRARPVVERLADIHERVRRAARTGEKADKAFFNREWGDEA
jgi:antitoxin VapB